MWTLIGAFDGTVTGEMNFQKAKLVKPGKEYIVGRKDCALVVNNKRVSRKHQVFTVGSYSPGDVENPDAIPSLKVHNIAANRHVYRKGDRLTLNAGAVMSLESGDEVEVLHDVRITVKWEKVICYCPPSHEPAIPSMEECANLGLNVVWKLHPNVTHHVVSELTMDLAVATSLLALAKFVTLGWLQTLVDRGTSSDPSTSLEHEFVLPSVSQHRPRLSSALPLPLQNYKIWEPNEAREKMLKPYRFIFVGESGREASEELIELAKRGDAGYHFFAVQRGPQELHHALAKGRERSQELVLVANTEAMLAAVGQEEWNHLTKEAAEYELSFINPARLVEAVVYADVSYIASKLTHSETATTRTAVPEVSSNTESSMSIIPPPSPISEMVQEAPAPRKKLVRRATSRAPSLPPPEVPQSGSNAFSETPASAVNVDASQAPRKRLVRRAGIAKPTIIGVDDPSIIEDGPIDTSSGTPAMLPPPPPTSTAATSRASRLKRRAGTTQLPESQLFAAIDASLMAAEQPHQKYKALFDESDPDKVFPSTGSSTQPETQSLVQSSTQASSRQLAVLLPVVAEEEEESMNPSGVVSQLPVQLEKPQGTKRTREDRSTAEMDVAERPTKRRNADHENNENQPPVDTPAGAGPPSAKQFTSTDVGQTRNAGANPGKPDKDEAFLKALASTKKGKKHEDSFDREFNNLRISKPDLEREKTKDDWAVLDDFGDDTNMRGNFMVVVEMEVFRKPGSVHNTMRTARGRTDWDGRPDFKKFKKKATGERRKPIELVVEDDGDSGLSQDTWNSGLDDPQPRSEPERVRPNLTERKTNLVVDSDEEVLPTSRSRKIQSQAKPEARPHTSKPTQKSAASQKKTQPLFLDSDEDEEVVEEMESLAASPVDDYNVEPEDTATLATTGLRTQNIRSTVQKRPAATLIIDDESDEEATFQGFGARKKARI